MDEQQMLLLTGLAGLLCFAAAVLLGIVAWVWMQRSREGQKTPQVKAAPLSAPPPVAAPPMGQGPASLPSGVDDAYSEDELPTVVVNPNPVHKPAALGSAPPLPTPQRSSGATIIAFDDDDDDDD